MSLLSLSLFFPLSFSVTIIFWRSHFLCHSHSFYCYFSLSLSNPMSQSLSSILSFILIISDPFSLFTCHCYDFSLSFSHVSFISLSFPLTVTLSYFYPPSLSLYLIPILFHSFSLILILSANLILTVLLSLLPSFSLGLIQFFHVPSSLSCSLFLKSQTQDKERKL